MWWLTLRAVLGLLALTVSAIGCGAWISHALPPTFRKIERAGITLLGGLGIFSLALFLIGQVSFTRTTIIAALGIGILFAIGPIWLAWQNRSSHAVCISRDAALPAFLVLLVLVLTAVAGLAEVTGNWESDPVAYHLLGPKVWLREGIIRPVPDDSLTAFPQISETLFAVMMDAGGSRGPGFFGWLNLGLLLLVSSGIAMRLGLNSSQAWWVAALVAAMPAVYTGSHECFVDGLYAAFVLAAARIGFDARRTREWIVFGMFCGLAMGTKYTGLLAFFTLAICCLFILARRRQANRVGSTRDFSLALLTACVVAAPFYIRNWILLGCPMYPPPPGYELVCTPKYFSHQAVEQLHAYIRVRGQGMGRGLLAFLRLPFNLTYHTANFNGAGGIGLCPLGLGPFGVVALRRETFARLLALLAFLLAVLWFLTEQESRFLIGVYVIGAIFSVVGWKYIAAEGGKAARWLAAILVAISISYGLFMIERSQSDASRAVFSQRYAANRRQQEIPNLGSFEYLNREPAVRKVLILDRSVTPYYLDKAYIKPEGQWGERGTASGLSSLEELQLARALGITHVLDVVSTVSGFQVDDPAADGLTLVYQAKDQRVYRVQ